MAPPRQKSADLPPFLNRVLPAWVTPLWLDSNRWRQVVRNQPVAIISRNRLITYLQALPWDVRARDLKETDALEADIRYYKEHVMKEFDVLMDMIWQDALDLPIGGTGELVRWPAGTLPTVDINGEQVSPTRASPLGHIDRIVHVDGATVAPTFDKTFPMMQRIQQNMSNPIFFRRHEMARILLQPRPELMIKGYGMPPPMTVFLAITLLFRGDQYYANLLLETPEAGILDLMDMDRDSAEEWVGSYRDLMSGIDPFKIGVLYEHTTPAKWIPFGRPPTEMMFDATTKKYARITTSGYWLTLSDIGLDDKGGSLGEAVRRQRETRSTGFGMIREKTKNFWNNQVLPPYLEFDFVEIDDEALTNMGRARLTNAQALKAMKEGGFITAESGLEQLKRDGLLTVEAELPEEPEPPPPSPQLPSGGQNGSTPEEAANQAADKVPVSQGGRGDVGVQRAPVSIGDPAISAAPTEASPFDLLAMAMTRAFDGIRTRMGEAQLRKLVKASTKLQFPTTSKAMLTMSNAVRAGWVAERVKCWKGEASVFDDIELVQKADGEITEALDNILGDDIWWELPENVAQAIVTPLQEAFNQGAIISAGELVRFLYEEGVLPSPDPIGLDFQLKNPATLELLDQSAAKMVRNVNNGTKTFLRRAITSGVDAGLSSQEITLRIQEGQDLDEIVRQTNLVDDISSVVRSQIEKMFEGRVASIVNTEIAMAETEGRRQQYKKTGLTQKRWVHTGTDQPCPVCQANIDMGLIGIDEDFESVFGSTQGPPAHPQVDHCHLEFDEDELIVLAGDPEKFALWDGS